ncbi:unnamed protein product [Cylindrotheca closterium]|uniref:Uncharacterized protein n=1 Tax=Cylindrotheca closterium TaxID=2856 RepID=A0AAD2CJI0_9STRA|nr:unnamed protein product [Cylindrotheca closterium]
MKFVCATFLLLAQSVSCFHFECSRKAFWDRQAQSALVAFGATIIQPSKAKAAYTPKPAELEKLRIGHARIKWLLENWDLETEVCGKQSMSEIERKQVIRTEGQGSGGCEKTPLNVQGFLGYKSTEDPLYRVEKLMIRAADLVVDGDVEGYLSVVEAYKDKADNSAMMAYTSSWGEANPNGGKEVIDEYLERTKLDVAETERYLRQILNYLNLEPLPARKNP